MGPFPAVPAWVASDVKDDEQELVTGGWYRVLSQQQHGETTHVRLRWIGARGDRVGSDDVLLDVLGALPRVVDSSLIRIREEALKIHMGGDDRAEVTRGHGAGTAEVVRYWEPDPPEEPWLHDDWSQYAAMRAASRKTTVPADVESIVAAVLRGKDGG